MFYEKELIERNFLTCLNCGCRYNVPTLLPCGSIICNCYKSMVSTGATYEAYVKCPFCHNEHKIPENGFPVMKQILSLLSLEPMRIEQQQLSPPTTPKAITFDKDLFNKLNTNIDAILTMTSKVQDVVNNTEKKIKSHFQTVKGKLENTYQNLVGQLEQYKTDLLIEIELNETEYAKNFMRMNEVSTAEDSSNGTSQSQWIELHCFLWNTREKVKKFKQAIETSDAMRVGPNGDQLPIKYSELLKETELIKKKLEEYIKSFDEIFFAKSKILIYKEPAATLPLIASNDQIDESLSNNLVLSEEVYGPILGKIEYQDFNYLAHTGKININRLEAKFLPRILNYASYEPSDDRYRALEILVSPFMDLKVVICSYRMTVSSPVNRYDVNLKLFDYANDFVLTNESWDMSNCHLYDMVAFGESIVLSIKNEFNTKLIQVYNQSLQVVRTFENSFYTDSIFANSACIYIVDTRVPFIHVLDWDMNEEFKSFGQNYAKDEKFFFSLDEKLLIKFNKLLALDETCQTIRVFNVDEDTFEKEISLKLDANNERVLITLDAEQKLIVTLLDKKIVLVYDSILNVNKTELKMLYRHDINEIPCVSSIHVTNEGFLMIHDLKERLIYLY